MPPYLKLYICNDLTKNKYKNWIQENLCMKTTNYLKILSALFLTIAMLLSIDFKVLFLNECLNLISHKSLFILLYAIECCISFIRIYVTTSYINKKVLIYKTIFWKNAKSFKSIDSYLHPLPFIWWFKCIIWLFLLFSTAIIS